MKSDVKTLIQATSMSLASIFGSGFLIIVPILAGVVGEFSVFAMAGVCVLAYAVGSVIRFNAGVARVRLLLHGSVPRGDHGEQLGETEDRHDHRRGAARLHRGLRGSRELT